MKSFLSVVVLVCAMGGNAWAKASLLGLNFQAPTVNDKANVANPVTGEIVYDSSDSTFYGRGSSSWTALSAAAPTAPTVQKFTSGSGTYTKPANVLYIKIRMVGAGGGGAGQGASGSNGSSTTFSVAGGAAILTAGYGTGGTTNVGGSGGSATVGSPAIGFGVSGTNGKIQSALVSGVFSGGSGGDAPFFAGGAAGKNDASNGSAAVANTGGGGGGAGTTTTGTTGAGGGSGAFIEASIASPSATYDYVIGAGGSGGSGTPTGGAGSDGIIIVEEYYQ